MKPVRLSTADARHLWLQAQRLDEPSPFGSGPQAVKAAVEHLGYVQIDTINVVERCHHHILFSRIPDYRRDDLAHAQTIGKTVFEYWTHALSYIPTRDLRFFLPEMKRHRADPDRWHASVGPAELRKAVARVRREGPLSIRDIDDDTLIEKDHPWASRKPTKRALQLGFYNGRLVISERSGMLKTYELMERHFDWDKPPRPATERQVDDYLLDRALRSQGLVSLDSVCHLNARRKPAISALIERRMRRRKLAPVLVEGIEKIAFWAEPDIVAQALETAGPPPALTHILSPFDPLIIQRKRLAALFGYEHLFEAYLPREKRRLGYFTLPVLAGDEIVAAIDMKADRGAGALLIQNWTWVGNGNPAAHETLIETELERFERFQLAGRDRPSSPRPTRSS